MPCATQKSKKPETAALKPATKALTDRLNHIVIESGALLRVVPQLASRHEQLRERDDALSRIAWTEERPGSWRSAAALQAESEHTRNLLMASNQVASDIRAKVCDLALFVCQALPNVAETLRYVTVDAADWIATERPPPWSDVESELLRVRARAIEAMNKINQATRAIAKPPASRRGRKSLTPKQYRERLEFLEQNGMEATKHKFKLLSPPNTTYWRKRASESE